MVTATDFQIDKNKLSRIGNGVFSYRSAAIAADAEVTGLIHGASDHQAYAADSLIISNIINDGDVALLVQTDGDSYEALWADASARILYLGHGMNSVTIRSDIVLPDDIDLALGTGSDALVRLSTANTGGGGTFAAEDLVIALDDASQSLHITDKAAVATDWALDDTTHPNVYIHSNTTPATDYLRLGGHDGTTAYVDVVGGTTLALQIAGTTEVSLTATAMEMNSNAINNIGASGFNLTSAGIVDVAGVSGNIWSSTHINHKGASPSLLERTSSNTNSIVGILTLQATSSGDMTDGFGTALSFRVEDTGVSDSILGQLGFRRAGADNTGDFVLLTWVTGSSNEAFKVDSGGEVYADLDGSGGSYLTNGVNLFDKYDDPMELQRYAYIQAPHISEDERQGNRQRMLDMGIIEKKDGGSGYHLKFQTFSRLVAGGIYQNAHRINNIEDRLARLGV